MDGVAPSRIVGVSASVNNIGPVVSTYKSTSSEKNWSSDFREIFTRCTGHRPNQHVTKLPKSDEGIFREEGGEKSLTSSNSPKFYRGPQNFSGSGAP